MKKISIIIPVFNEAESIPILAQKIELAMLQIKKYTYELIFIDDGSIDDTSKIISKLTKKNNRIKGIIFRKNFGQSPATSAGIDHTSGDIIIIMDGDLQNDPGDIPKLIKKIENGADIVSGWRKNRKDNKIFRNIPSWVANRLVRKLSGIKIHDLGCSLKAYRREIIKNVTLYGEMHRFIVIYANMRGAKVDEVVVNHHPRQYGYSKYGLNRIFKVLLDLIIMKYMMSYSIKPIYFFGKIALFFLGCGMVSFIALLLNKFYFDGSIVRSPLLLLTAMLFMTVIQILSVGVIAEILMRTYHEAQKKPIYLIRKTIGRFNFGK
jgi:glycosyltransferase involved in cell wall biosynthesis